MKDMGEVFTLARDNLASIHKTHVKWGLTR
jgi:hypothetical protein